MVSINAASYSALRSLQSVNAQLDATQNRIATGLKVASAKDGAGAWSAALAIRADIKTADAVISGINANQSAAEVYGAAADSIIEALNDMKSLVTKHGNTTDTTERAQILEEIKAAQNQVKVAIGVSVKGASNWMTTAAPGSVTVGYEADGDAITQAVTKADIVTAVTASNALTTADFTDAATAKTAAGTLDTAITAVTTFATNMGALASGLESAKSLLSKISDIKEAALSRLVDADMEKESALLSALQVKQSLATQALSIANSSGQNVLRLFQ